MSWTYHEPHDWTTRCGLCNSWPEWALFLIGQQTIDHEMLETIMADLTALTAAASGINDEVTAVVSNVAAAVTALNDLSAKIAAGGSADQSEVDAITAQLSGATSNLETAAASLTDAVSTDDPSTVPAVPEDGSTPAA